MVRRGKRRADFHCGALAGIGVQQCVWYRAEHLIRPCSTPRHSRLAEEAALAYARALAPGA